MVTIVVPWREPLQPRDEGWRGGLHGHDDVVDPLWMDRIELRHRGVRRNPEPWPPEISKCGQLPRAERYRGHIEGAGTGQDRERHQQVADLHASVFPHYRDHGAGVAWPCTIGWDHQLLGGRGTRRLLSGSRRFGWRPCTCGPHHRYSPRGIQNASRESARCRGAAIGR